MPEDIVSIVWAGGKAENVLKAAARGHISELMPYSRGYTLWVFLQTILDLKSAGSCPEFMFSKNKCVYDPFQNIVLWYYFNCSNESWISTLIFYHWLKSAGSQLLSILFSFTRLNYFKSSVVDCSHFKVGGKRDSGGRGKSNIEVSSENETSKTFCCSVAFVNLAVYIFSVGWSLLCIWFASKTTSPFPHSICDVSQVMLHVPSRWGEMKADAHEVCTYIGLTNVLDCTVPLLHNPIWLLAKFWSNKYYKLWHVFVTVNILTDQCYMALVSVWCCKMSMSYMDQWTCLLVELWFSVQCALSLNNVQVTHFF